jgi:hypothetical protein
MATGFMVAKHHGKSIQQTYGGCQKKPWSQTEPKTGEN